MAKRDDISPEMIRQLFDYNPDTGVLTWKTRTPDMFEDGGHSAAHTCAAWNAKFAGKTTGCADNKGYLVVGINNKNYFAHRVIWCLVHGEWPNGEVDHHDLNPCNNTIGNLRDLTQAENSRNREKNSNNTSGAKGVSYCRRTKKYAAIIWFERTPYFLGRFKTVQEASAAYDAASTALHGPCGRLNDLSKKSIVAEWKPKDRVTNRVNKAGKNASGPMSLAKKVKCIETGIIYDSASDAGRATKTSAGSIITVCRKSNPHRKTAGGYRWSYAHEEVIE